MNTTKTSRTQLGKLLQVAAIAVIASAVSTSVVLADNNGDTTIAVKFNNGGTTFASSSTAGPNGSTLGGDNIRTTNWNIQNAVGTLSNLNEDTSGVASNSGASLTTAGTMGNSYSGNTNGFSPGQFGNSDGGLMGGGFQPGSGNSVSVASLGSEFTANGYDLYIYSEPQNGGWGTKFTLTAGGSGNLTASGANSPYSTYINNSNYVEFTGLTAASFTFTAATSGGPNANINGFEIVALPGSVPEPSTYALLLGGVVALGFCVRRRQSSI